MKYKVFTSVLLAVFFLFAATGCIRTEDEVLSEESDTEKTEETVEYYDVGETVTASDYEAKVNSICYFSDLDAGYVMVDITYTNTTDKKITLDTTSDIQCYLDNEMATQVLYPDFPGIVDENLLFNQSQKINPGRSKTGILIYTYFREWDNIEIQIFDSIVSASFRSLEDVSIIPDPDPIEPSEAVEIPTESVPEPEPEPEPVQEDHTYIADTSLMVFHRPECSALEPVPEEFRTEIVSNYQNMVNSGYVACELCAPD